MEAIQSTIFERPATSERVLSAPRKLRAAESKFKYSPQGERLMLDEMGPQSPAGPGRLEFAECLRHLHDGHKGIALAHIRRALKVEPQNPFFLSYAGMLCAVAEKRFTAGEKLCREALEIKCNHAQLYLNLAEVYRQERRDGDAIKTLRKGFISAGQDIRIRKALEKFGGRRVPVLTSLARRHPLNRLLGKLRHQMIGPAI